MEFGGFMIARKQRLKIKKSEFPDNEGTHILILETSTEHGWGYRRIFKGTYQSCLDKRKEMEENNESKSKNTRIFRKKQNNNNIRKCTKTRNN